MQLNLCSNILYIVTLFVLVRCIIIISINKNLFLLKVLNKVGCLVL